MRRGARRVGAGMVLALVCVSCPGSASGASLPAAAAARFDGPLAGELGSSVAAAGDFNGDGLDDVVLGAPEPDQLGKAFVVFGRPGLGAVDLGRFGSLGVRIVGEDSEDGRAGTSVAGAGDVNGDGLADVVVTDPRAPGVVRGRGRVRQSVDGVAYVVYGRRSAGTVRLARLGAGGFAIKGVEDSSAAGAGDVNGDGLADVIVAAGDRSDGGAYVVFGAPRRRSFDAARLGRRGFAVHGAPGDQQAGPAAGAGDVNGDGLDDLVVGAPVSLGAPPPRDAYEAFGGGAAYVVFGQRSNATVKVDDRGFRIAPPPRQIGLVGAAVAGAGDVNGDGLADVVVGAPALPLDIRGNRFGPGSAFVVFGAPTPDTVTLGEALGGRGFEIRGGPGARGAGTAVAGIGDHDGDGLGDLLIGAPGDPDSDDSGAPPGAAFLVYGRAGTGRVELSALAATDGLAFEGLPGDGAGSAVAAAGDPDADGRPDLLIGAPTSCPAVRPDSDHLSENPTGVAYLVTPNPSSPMPMTGGPGRDLLAGGAAADRLRAAAGDDCVYGLAGPDRLFGGNGADSLLAAGGDDALHAGSGHDFADAGPGDDRLIGGPGRDSASGGSGNDRIDGGPGADSLDGAAGGDRLSGRGGDDELAGEGGRDRLTGGRGRDVLFAGPGRDLLDGGPGPDYMVGEGGADRLRGGPGRDHLEGSDRRARLFGGAGDDILRAGLPYGGAGDDLIQSRNGRPETVRCGAGSDRVWADPGDRLRGCERTLHTRPRALR